MFWNLFLKTVFKNSQIKHVPIFCLKKNRIKQNTKQLQSPLFIYIQMAIPLPNFIRAFSQASRADHFLFFVFSKISKKFFWKLLGTSLEKELYEMLSTNKRKFFRIALPNDLFVQRENFVLGKFLFSHEGEILRSYPSPLKVYIIFFEKNTAHVLPSFVGKCVLLNDGITGCKVSLYHEILSSHRHTIIEAVGITRTRYILWCTPFKHLF